MKLSILREDLNKTLNQVVKFIPARPNLPILSNVYLKAEKTGLSLTTTNLETSIKVKVAAKVEEEGETTVPARVFAEFVGASKEVKLILETKKDNLEVRGINSEVSLATINPLEFPKIVEAGKQTLQKIDPEEFVSALNQITFAAAADEARPILTGVLVKKENKNLILVATDGYRLAKRQTKLEVDFPETVIPARTLQEVSKIVSEAEGPIAAAFLAENNQILLSGENFEVSSRVLDGSFPTYEQIIPKQFVVETSFSREDLNDAIRQTAVLAKDLGSVVQMELSGGKELALKAKTAQIGEASIKVAGSVSGEKLKTAFNSRYLLEGLAAFKSKEININFSGPTSPALIFDKDDPNFSYIVMPVRIQD